MEPFLVDGGAFVLFAAVARGTNKANRYRETAFDPKQSLVANDCAAIQPKSQIALGLPAHALSSRLSSFQKRQSVPAAIILCGLDLIIPASCIRNA
jgi:hypothetical protein